MKHLFTFNIFESEFFKGGVANGMSPEDLADHHDIDVDIIRDALAKGKAVEMEHTDDPKKAYEIAKDHIYEDPKYYDKLAKIEERDWNDAKPGPDTYHKGLSDDEIEDKEDQMKKQAKMDDDDPEAYKEMPGDKEAREKGKVKTSKHVKSYHDLYGDETDEALSDYEEDGIDYDELYKDYPYKPKDKKRRRRNESIVTEEKLDDAAESGLKKKSEETGVPIGILRDVYKRGLAAWKSGHRPGANQQQWAYARVNSFLTKQPGTWGGADEDLAKKVRDGGYDTKLKKA